MEIDARTENEKLQKSESLKKRITKVKENTVVKEQTKPKQFGISAPKMVRNDPKPTDPPKPPCVEWLRNGISIVLNLLATPVGQSESKRRRFKEKMTKSNDIMSFLTLDLGKYALRIPREMGAGLTYLSLLLETRFEPDQPIPEQDQNIKNP